ncbi:glycosyltransferase [Pelagibacterales bacterium SAG-MED39]|nr:glycosyltransferase [Pelagibacterales bacterium SAG-MED39]
MKQKIYFYYPNIVNDGIKKTFKIYYNYLKKNYNVVLVSSLDTKLAKEYKKNYVSSFLRFKNFKILNSILCALKIILLRDKNKIVFSLDDHLIILIFRLIGFNFKLALRTANPIYNIYNKDEIRFLKNKGFTNKYETYLYKYADLVITYSKQNVLSLKKKFKVKNVHLIYNFFEKHNFKKKIKKKTYNIFFIGRFVDSKDPVFFIKNMLKLIGKINIKVYLLGEGILKDELENISKRFKKNIKILKFIKKPFDRYKNKIDLLCVTSKFDGTPNVLGEAISKSIPCLAPKNVGLANILLNNGKSGYLYKQNNDESFQLNVLSAIKNYSNAIRKSKIAFNGLNKFSKKNTLQKLDALIKKLN